MMSPDSALLCSLSLIIATAGLMPASGSVLSRCDMYNLVTVFNLTGSAEDWVCLVAEGSSYDTGSESRYWDGSRYGLFQMHADDCRPDKRWPHNTTCDALCTEFKDNAVADDFLCAETVYKVHGYSYWPQWSSSCDGQDLSGYISGCR